MFAIANFVNKYNSSSKSKHVVPYDKVKATEKWIEYALDIVDMQRALMQTKNIDEKFKLMSALEVAERKKAYMYRHKNFDLSRASFIFSKVRDIAKNHQ